MGSIKGCIGRHRTGAALGGIAVLGLLLRLPGMDYCMAPDEAFTFTLNTVRGLRSVLLGPYLAGNHIFTTVTTWVMYNLVGDYDWAFQLPVLVLGMAGVLVAYPVAKLLFQSRAAGLGAAFFFAWAPYHVAYSTNARGYCPMFLFIMLSAALLYLCLQKATILRLLGLVLVTFFMGMSHLSSLVMFGAWAAVLGGYAVGITLYKPWRTRRNLVSWALTCAALAVGLALIDIAYSPVFSMHRGLLGRAFEGQWPMDISIFLAGAEQTEWTPVWQLTETNTGLKGIPFWVGCGLATAGMVISVWRGNYGALICLAGLAAPLTAIWVFSLKLGPRYSLFLLPFCVLTLGAGTALCAEAAGRLLGRVRIAPGWMRPVVAGLVFAGVSAYFAHAVTPLYKENFPAYSPVMACVINDHKSAVRFAASQMDDDDVLFYPRNFTYPVEHYVERYFYRGLRPGPAAPQRFNAWMVSGLPTPPLEQIPGAAPPALRASYHNAYVWSTEVVAQNLRRVELPAFEFEPNVPLMQCLKAWQIEGLYDHAEVEIAENAGTSPDRILLVTGTAWDMYWGLFAPPEPLAPGRLAVVSGQVRAADITRHGVGLALRFLDAQRAVIAEWPIRVPCQADSAGQPQWKTFYLGMLAPEGTCYVSAGLQVTTPVSVGVPVAFRRIGLWVDSPMATAEPPVEAAAAGGT
jgi:hypothetical protein